MTARSTASRPSLVATALALTVSLLGCASTDGSSPRPTPEAPAAALHTATARSLNQILNSGITEEATYVPVRPAMVTVYDTTTQTTTVGKTGSGFAVDYATSTEQPGTPGTSLFAALSYDDQVGFGQVIDVARNPDGTFLVKEEGHTQTFTLERGLISKVVTRSNDPTAGDASTTIAITYFVDEAGNKMLTDAARVLHTK